MRVALHTARADREGFAALARLHAQRLAAGPQRLLIDCGSVAWRDAQLCAPLHELLASAAARLQPVDRFVGLTRAVQASLCRSGLLARLGYNIVPDHFRAAVPLQQFRDGDSPIRLLTTSPKRLGNGP